MNAVTRPGRRCSDDLAELRATLAADTRLIYSDWLAEVVPDRSVRLGSRAVDLGCGSGRFADLLVDRYQYVLGVDVDEQEVAHARAEHGRPRLRFEVRSLFDVAPEIDGQWDLVFSVDTLHRVRAHDLVLPHLRSLVAPGGDVIVVDAIDPGQWRSRDWQVAEAFRDAEDSYRSRSLEVETAVEVLRLRLHPAWLQQVARDVPLPREEFGQRYAAAFPGATFTELHTSVLGMHWRAPD